MTVGETSAPDRLRTAGVYVLACGALARELTSIVSVNGLDRITVEYLPARLHNTPDQIPALVDERLTAAAATHAVRFVAYADCGTGGLLDRVLERHGVERLPGAHCYEFFAGDLFHRLQDREPGTFYLTDYLTRHFDRLVWEGLGIDRHPQLRDMYFGNYRRLVYLSQANDPGLVIEATAAADRLGLTFEHHHVGLGALEPAMVSITRRKDVA
ncbi:MAG: DUF1638 domain-containing protein [Acidimicrobiia bacterium]